MTATKEKATKAYDAWCFDNGVEPVTPDWEIWWGAVEWAVSHMPPTVPCIGSDEVQKLRAGLEDVLAYVRGKDDLYANGALRQIAEDALGEEAAPTVPEVTS